MAKKRGLRYWLRNACRPQSEKGEPISSYELLARSVYGELALVNGVPSWTLPETASRKEVEFAKAAIIVFSWHAKNIYAFGEKDG